MLQFISLGSGSSGNCYYLECDGTAILIDLGIGYRRFRKLCNDYGISIAKIKAMLLTHDHADHIKAAGLFSSTFRIPVYTSEKVHASFLANHFITKKVPEGLRMTFAHGEEINIGPFSIYSFYVPHDSAENNGYLIQVGDKNIVIMTDVGHFTEEMQQAVGMATHLIIEANYDEQMLATGRYPMRLKRRIASPTGHSSNSETAAVLARHLDKDKIQRIWLCHLSAENNTPALATETITKELSAAGFVIDDDHLKLTALPRTVPSGFESL